MELGQVAISVRDGEGTAAWYRDVLGFAAAGGLAEHRPYAAAVQGMEVSKSTILWLVDQHASVQLELFSYDEPVPRGEAAAHAVNDHGYGLLGLHVADLDAVLARVAPLTAPLGEPGARRVCVRDPEGVLLELMEDGAPAGPARPALPVATRFVRLTVSSLPRAREFFAGTLGLAEGPPLHGPEHEALWGLPGADVATLALWGGDVALELAEYAHPRGLPRPADHRLSDHGLLNVALIASERERYDRAVAAQAATGFPAYEEVTGDAFAVRYAEDGERNSVELLHIAPHHRATMGFEPLP